MTEAKEPKEPTPPDGLTDWQRARKKQAYDAFMMVVARHYYYKDLAQIGGDSRVTLEFLHMLRAFPAETTVGELVAAMERSLVRDTCRHCGKAISRLVIDEQATWQHEDAARSRGCRAASFDSKREGFYDDSLRPRSVATPERVRA